MLLNLLLILGACVAGVVFGLFVYWIIFRIKKTLWAKQPNSMEAEKPTLLTITEDIGHLSSEQSLKEAKYAPDIQTATETDDDWQNHELREVDASTIREKDDEWLNAGVEEVPTKVYKQQDDSWLNAENNQSLKTSEEFSSNRATTKREIQIEQDGSIFHITVTSSYNQDTRPDQTMINLRINLSPQDSIMKGERSYDIELTAEGSSPSYLSLQDNLTVKPAEEPIYQGNVLMDEISVRPVESQANGSHALMDEISVRPVEIQVTKRYALMDEISVRPVEIQVTERYALMDEISVRLVESQVTESYALIDEISVKAVEIQVSESSALMDEISVKPTPSPVNIEYELLDDLITKTALYRTKKAITSDDLVIINPVEKPVEKENTSDDVAIINLVEELLEEEKTSNDVVKVNPLEKPVEKAPPVKTISMHEITEMLKEERDLKLATITPATGTQKLPIFSLDIPSIAIRFKVLLMSLVCLTAMAIAELTIYRISPIGGIVVYFVVLFGLIIISVLTKNQSQRDFYIALGLAPLMRIILLAVPGILVISQYFLYIVVAIPMIAGIISISRIISFNMNDIGLNLNKPFTQFSVAITGIGLAMVDYLILKPVAWTSVLTIQEVLLPAIVLLIFTGLIEEFSFRGVMQRASVVIGSYGWIFIAAVYAVLQIWQGSVLHCVFCFGISLFFGWIVNKTGSILGVSLAHGFMNIGLYLVLPHIVKL